MGIDGETRRRETVVLRLAWLTNITWTSRSVVFSKLAYLGRQFDESHLHN